MSRIDRNGGTHAVDYDGGYGSISRGRNVDWEIDQSFLRVASEVFVENTSDIGECSKRSLTGEDCL